MLINVFTILFFTKTKCNFKKTILENSACVHILFYAISYA